MRLTVGPLPPAVYWRRRAIVLGAILTVALTITYSCGASADPAAAPGDAGSPEAVGTSAASTAPDAASPGDAGTRPSTPAVPAGSATSAPAAPDVKGPCTDAEISVTPVPERTSLPRGVPIRITIKIKNVSNRTCTRDVGADYQELRIVAGADKIWSSDDCGGARGSDPRPFSPNFERSYTVTWDGHASTRCTDPRPIPAAGQYQLYGRLGTKLSRPVTLTLT